jgi:protein phosphatase methylesterase 1
MSELQRAWARSKVALPSTDSFDEAEEEQDLDQVPELPDHGDDDSSSASSMSSTGTIIPSPNQKLFARPHRYTLPTAGRYRLSLSVSRS